MSKDISRFLSLVLRHSPEKIGLSLDPNGWTSVDDLLAKLKASGRKVDRETLFQIVETNDKKRFTLSPDHSKIRAAQGHSLAIDLALTSREPPEHLFHGTAKSNLDAIMKEGLKPQKRRHVHLSSDVHTARKVGERHGTPVVLRIETGQMYRNRMIFWQADNGVWLVDCVAPEYLSFA